MNALSDPIRRTYLADPSCRMSDQDKSEVMYIFDLAALERLISMLPPEDRADVLSHFQYGEQGSEEAPPKLVSFNDPHLQAVLEEVWVPYWDTMPAAALHSDSPIPGRQLALDRKQAGG